MKPHRMTSIQGRHFEGMWNACLAALLLIGGMASAHGAGVFRVDAASAAPTPDGQSWETAYPTLQAGADAAAAAGGGELWVKAGTYTGSGDQVAWLSGGIALYGGFAGGETDLTQRDWKANPTVIDGQNARRCVTVSAGTTLDGFTVANGKALQGGGMYGGTAANCVFIRNSAGVGGGMYSGTAVNCDFTGNTATDGSFGYGGGMYSGMATNCTFTGNSAVATGAGLAPADAAGGGMWGGTAVNCRFTGNLASATTTGSELATSSGGGMWEDTAINCIFAGNSATAIAAGLGSATSNGGGKHGGSATNCVFTENSTAATGRVSDASHGGGLHEGMAMNCTFTGNLAAAGSDDCHGGGAFYISARNCIFWGNMASNTPELFGITVTYSCVRGGHAGVGNIADYPKFAGAPDNLRLLPGSPCLDTGTGMDAPADDITGHVRPQGAGVDMGAYESAALGVPHAPVVGADGSGANPPTWTWTPGGGGIGQYRFGFAEGIWEAVDLAATAYTPPIPLPAGGHTLYVQERDALGNWSASGTHTLTVSDTASPAGAVVINGNAATTASSTVALALTWDDGLNGSGVSRMRFSNDGITWSPWERAASLKSWTLPAGTGYKTVRAQFLDRSGNRSAVCSDYIKVVVP